MKKLHCDEEIKGERLNIYSSTRDIVYICQLFFFVFNRSPTCGHYRRFHGSFRGHVGSPLIRIINEGALLPGWLFLVHYSTSLYHAIIPTFAWTHALSSFGSKEDKNGFKKIRRRARAKRNPCRETIGAAFCGHVTCKYASRTISVPGGKTSFPVPFYSDTSDGFSSLQSN